VIGTFCGAGLAPKAPGTVGSLASLVLWAPLVLLGVAWWVRASIALALFVAGTVAADAVVRAEGREDPQKIVMDEVVGMGLTLLFAHSLASLVAGTVLFRVFDIAKPWPVSLADRRVKGGFGVMLDDVLAAGYALACLLALERWAWPALAVALPGIPA
jgi:phosphatidylglycerophosphatase A